MMASHQFPIPRDPGRYASTVRNPRRLEEMRAWLYGFERRFTVLVIGIVLGALFGSMLLSSARANGRHVATTATATTVTSVTSVTTTRARRDLSLRGKVVDRPVNRRRPLRA